MIAQKTLKSPVRSVEELFSSGTHLPEIVLLLRLDVAAKSVRKNFLTRNGNASKEHTTPAKPQSKQPTLG